MKPVVMHNEPKILAFIPCYNEALNLEALLKEFESLPFMCDTLVIDDGSQDNTQAIASKYSRVIRFNENMGLARVISSALEYALKHGYDYCIQIDGDGQHIPSEIESFITVLREKPSDFLLGSRYAKKNMQGPLHHRRMAGIIISIEIFALFKGTWISDPCSGMRMYSARMMRDYLDLFGSNTIDLAIIPIALKAEKTVCEVPVRMRKRQHGASYLSGFKGLGFLLRFIFKIISIRLS